MSDPPSLLLLWTDQQAFRTMGAYGNDAIETPNLDRLAESGIVFENAYCSTPLCTPARSTIMTGQYPHETGCITNNVPLDGSIPCLPELTTDEYATGHVGKWHLGDEVFPQHGFDEWVSIEDGYNDEDTYTQYFREGRDRSARSDYHHYLVEQGYEPDLVDDHGHRFSREFSASLPEEHSKPAFMARRASDFIERHRDEPFILSVNFLEPHTPYTGPRDDQYDPDEVPLPANFERDSEDLSAHRSIDYWSSPPTEDEWRETISNYWGLVSLVDTHVGHILDSLGTNDRDSDTVVAFTSDHGDLMGSHGRWGKGRMFEESAHIPLLMRVPGVESGRRISPPFGHVDFVPTLLEAMDQPIPDAPSGRSWYPAIRGETDPPSDPVLLESHQTNDVDRRDLEGATEEEIRRWVDGHTRAIVTPDGWKYVFRTGRADSLYDLSEDPYETRDRIDDPGPETTVTDLETELAGLQDRFDDPLARVNR